MAYSLTWLPDVLLRAGLQVAEVPGWRERGRGDVGPIEGVLCHHTASGDRPGNMPALRVLIEGRPDLRGPLSQLGLGRDGTYYVIAAGRAQHAGQGMWAGVTNGNAHFIGIEGQHSGRLGDPWPAKQMQAYQHGVAAILQHLGLPVERCAGHKEWAPRRKIDPTFDMRAFRTEVAQIMDGSTPAIVPVPSVEPSGAKRPTLRRGSTGEYVVLLHRLLGMRETRLFDAYTEARVREFQRAHGLVPDGIFGPKSWAVFDAQSREPLRMAATP